MVLNFVLLESPSLSKMISTSNGHVNLNWKLRCYVLQCLVKKELPLNCMVGMVDGGDSLGKVSIDMDKR